MLSWIGRPRAGYWDAPGARAFTEDLMIKLLFLVAVGVAGYFIVKRILSEDTGPVETDYYRPSEPSQAAS